jgi:outer membrane protein assembly factor BamD (BamD/ComL family)
MNPPIVSPSREALQILIEAYDKLDLKPLAVQSRQVYETNYQGDVREAKAANHKSWWQFWR